MTGMKLRTRWFTCVVLLCSLGCGLGCLANDDVPPMPIHYINRSSNAVTVLPYSYTYREALYSRYKKHLQKEDDTDTREKYLNFCRGMILDSKKSAMNQIIPANDGIYIRRCTGDTKGDDVQPSTGDYIVYMWWSAYDYINARATKVTPYPGWCLDGEMSVRICMVTTKLQAKDAKDSNSLEQDGQQDLYSQGPNGQEVEILCSSPYTSAPLRLRALISGPQLALPASCTASSAADEQFSTDEAFEKELARVAGPEGTTSCAVSHPETADEASDVYLYQKKNGIKILAVYVLIDDVKT